MSNAQLANSFTQRFISLGAIDPPSFADRVLTAVREWLVETIELPPKAVVLAAVAEALDRAFKGIDTPGPDMIVEPAIKSMILGLVGFAYDQLDKQVVV